MSLTFNKWTSEEEDFLFSLLDASMNLDLMFVNFASRHLSGTKGFEIRRTKPAIARKLLRITQAKPIQPVTKPETPAKQSETKNFWTKLLELEEKYKESFQVKDRGRLDPKAKKRKILCISDIHLPLTRMDLLEAALKEHSDADVVVVNGDIMDGYAFSSYEKTKKIAAIDEYIAAFNLIKILSESFPTVVLVDGNHDIRAARVLGEAGISKEDAGLFRPNLIKRIANGEEIDQQGDIVKTHNFDNVLYQEANSWYVRVGKTIFCHPHNVGSSAPGFTVNRVFKEYFKKKYSFDDYDSIVCGHTHKIYKGVEDSVLLIEQGCLASFMSYSWSPKLKYTTNAMNGFAVIYQDENGNTDFNLSGPIFLGELVPKKKAVL